MRWIRGSEGAKAKGVREFSAGKFKPEIGKGSRREQQVSKHAKLVFRAFFLLFQGIESASVLDFLDINEFPDSLPSYYIIEPLKPLKSPKPLKSNTNKEKETKWFDSRGRKTFLYRLHKRLKKELEAMNLTPIDIWRMIQGTEFEMSQRKVQRIIEGSSLDVEDCRVLLEVLGVKTQIQFFKS